jgi:hypothetical protein
LGDRARRRFHTGQRQIADYLIQKGARPDIFSAAMLGQLEVVKAFVAARPGIQGLHGPHGITLLAHAEAGGADAAPVLRYLRELGGADAGYPAVPLTDVLRDADLGIYAFGEAPEDRFEIAPARRRRACASRSAVSAPLHWPFTIPT